MKKLLCFVLIFSLYLPVAQAEQVRSATIKTVDGSVEIRTEGGEWKPAAPGMKLYEKDEIRTGENSEASLYLDGEGETGDLKLAEKSHMRLGTLLKDNKTEDKVTYLDLALGKVLVHAEKLRGQSKFEVRTPNASAGVRGTVLEVSVED